VPYLNPASFQLPPTAATATPYAAAFGNFGKGAVSGPGSATWDVGLFRSFSLHERGQIQVRGEFFNVLNRVNFNNPTASISSGGFGSISGAGDPRIGQVALKLTF
jgi:hypothetical protein